MKLLQWIGVGFAAATVIAKRDLDDRFAEKARPYAALLLVQKKKLDAAANQALAAVAREAQAEAARSRTVAGA